MGSEFRLREAHGRESMLQQFGFGSSRPGSEDLLVVKASGLIGGVERMPAVGRLYLGQSWHWAR